MDLAPYVRSVLYGVIITSAFSVLCAIAPLSYLAVYQWYIPYKTAEIPIYLDFSSNFGAVDRVPLSTINAQLAQSVDYSMSVKFVLPRSERNTKLGNFQVETSVSNGNSKPIGFLTDNDFAGPWPSRPAILPYKSHATQLLDNVVLYPLYLFGYRCDEATVEPVMFETWSKGAPLNGTSLQVKIDRTVDVQQASLVYYVKWEGVRYLMHHYKLTMFVLGTGFFWAIEAAVAAVVALIVVNLFSQDSSRPTPPRSAFSPSSSSALTASSLFDHHPKDKPPLQILRQDQNKAEEQEGQLAKDFRQRVEINDPKNLLQEPTPAPESDYSSESESNGANNETETDTNQVGLYSSSETTEDEETDTDFEQNTAAPTASTHLTTPGSHDEGAKAARPV